jgi:hypothetical protein
VRQREHDHVRERVVRAGQRRTALAAGLRVAADPGERAPEALARRLLDVLAEATLVHLLAHARQRVPERLPAHARRVGGEQRPEGADRRADRRRTDAQHRQAFGLGEHQGAEEIERTPA